MNLAVSLGLTAVMYTEQAIHSRSKSLSGNLTFHLICSGGPSINRCFEAGLSSKYYWEIALANPSSQLKADSIYTEQGT